ncbi:site-specific integrase [Salmonella enterica]|nr:site-specific integrase [Salmonella enterica]
MSNIYYDEKDLFLIAVNSGYKFSISEPIWILDKNIKLNMNLILNELDISHHVYFLKTLSCFATTRSSFYTKKMFYAFYDFVTNSKKGLISDLNLVNYHALTLKTKPDYIDSLRVFLKKWFDMEYPGVTVEHVKILYKGKVKRRKKGEMVKIMDLNKGPMLESDIINFNEGAMLLYEKGVITIAELTMVLLTSYTGRRPIQTSHLKLKDILSLFGENRNEIALNYPRAKHSGAFRTEFSKLKIVEDINDLMVILSNYNINVAEQVLCREMTDKEIIELPLFIDFDALNQISNSDDLYKLLLTDFFHIKDELITRVIKKVKNKLNSLQYAEVINARRFRYSLGTRAAQEGYGMFVIAELLDHRSIKHVGCYVQNVPEYAEKIDEVMTKSLLNYAKAFNGELVHLNTGEHVIKNHNGIDSGNCSNCGDCNAPIPIPCYTCPFFKPWIDAPHKDVYEFLLKERIRLADLTGDVKIATALDRTIVAVKEVICKCNSIKNGDTNECS